MAEEKVERRGGYRPNSGRRCSVGSKRETMTFRLPAETKQKAIELKNKGVVLSRLLEDAINRHYADLISEE